MNNSGCPLCKSPIISDKKHSKRVGFNPQGQELDFNQEEIAIGEDETRRGLQGDSTSKSESKIFSSKICSDAKKLKTFKKILKTMNWIETSSEPSEEFMAETGAITYSLPCEAVYNRNIRNEIKRLEIEMYNRKILEMYDNPAEAFANFEEDMKKLKSKTDNKNNE